MQFLSIYCLLQSITIDAIMCYYVSVINGPALQGCDPGQHIHYSHSVQAGWSRDQILVGARFSAPIQTSPGVHPASYTMGTGSFPGVKRPGHDIGHPPQSSAEVKEGVELYLCSPSGPSWPVLGRTLPLPLPCQELAVRVFIDTCGR